MTVSTEERATAASIGRLIRFDLLATYNAEVARGLVHTDIWKHKMAEIQSEFEEQQRTAARAVTGQPNQERTAAGAVTNG